MSTARIPDGTPLGLVQVGLAISDTSLDMGRSNHPVKPSHAAVRPASAGSKPVDLALRPGPRHKKGQPQ